MTIDLWKMITNELLNIPEILDVLDEMWFKICNNDWGFSEVKFTNCIIEISNAIDDEKPENKKEYIIEYVKKNYPFNI